MKKPVMTWLLRLNVFTIIIIPLIFSNGCSTFEVKWEHRQECSAKMSFSGKNMATSMGRGGANIALCWLEVPCTIKSKMQSRKTGEPFGIIPNTFAVTFGAVKGSIRTAKRLVGGTVEVALSPFPPYEPLLHPPFPPYIMPKTNDVEKALLSDKVKEKCLEAVIAPE